MFEIVSKDSLHHAYILIGKRSSVLPELASFMQNILNIKIARNPNVLIKEYMNFSIDDARELQELHSRKAAVDGQRFFIIAADSLTFQAQNGLLKILEEPAARTHFFLIAPSLSRMLPTLQSRVVILQQNKESRDSSFNDMLAKAQNFLKAPKAKRLKLVKEMLADIEKEKSTKQDAIVFLQAIMTVLHSKKSSEWTSKDVFILTELAKMNEYIQDQSSSIKLIFEYTALIV